MELKIRNENFELAKTKNLKKKLLKKMHIILQGKENNTKFGQKYASRLESTYVI